MPESPAPLSSTSRFAMLQDRLLNHPVNSTLVPWYDRKKRYRSKHSIIIFMTTSADFCWNSFLRATCINTIWGYSNTDINVLMPKIYTYCIALKTLLPNIFMTPRRMWMMPTLTYALWSSKLQRTASRGAEKAPTYLAGTRNTRYTPLPRLTKRKLKKATNCWTY